MVERAESTLIKGYILVKTNVRLFQNKYPAHLHNQFKCCDPNCGVPLSCAVWNEKNSRMEPYFYISNHNFPHVAGCKEVNQSEKQSRVDSDRTYAYKCIQDKKLITLGNTVQSHGKRTTSNIENVFEKMPKATFVKSANNHSNLTKNKQNRISLLDSMISIYNDNNFNNDSEIKLDFNFQLYPNLSIKYFENEEEFETYLKKQNYRKQNVKRVRNTKCKSTLNSLFYMISEEDLPFNTFHIFYGKAKFWESTQKPGLVYVFFNSLKLNKLKNGKKLNFKFNKDQLSEHNRKFVEDALQNSSEVEIYFQGAFSEGESNIYMIPLTIQNYNSIVFR